VTLPPLAIAAFVGSGSAPSTPKTKRGIAALSIQVKRAVKASSWNRQLTALSRGNHFEAKSRLLGFKGQLVPDTGHL
jgi:hypothetical protein